MLSVLYLSVRVSHCQFVMLSVNHMSVNLSCFLSIICLSVCPAVFHHLSVSFSCCLSITCQKICPRVFHSSISEIVQWSSIHLSVSSINLSVSFHFVCPSSVSLSSSCLSICQSVYLMMSVHPSVSQFVQQSYINMSVSLSYCLSTHLSVSLSCCLSSNLPSSTRLFVMVSAIICQ